MPVLEHRARGCSQGCAQPSAPRAAQAGGLEGPRGAPKTPELEGALRLNWVVFHLFLPPLSSSCVIMCQHYAGFLLGGEKLWGTIGTGSCR